MKVAYNTCFGGFSLSHKAIMRYAEIKGIKLYPFLNHLDKNDPTPATEADLSKGGLTMIMYSTEPVYSSKSYYDARHGISRADPALIQVIIELGKEASGSFASLALCEVAPGQRYRIDEYDGNETVMTVDDYEWEIAI